jgi:Trypsin-like peptidase domain
MFANAYEKAKHFTRPVAMSARLESGQVTCGLGTFVIVNREGWIITAAHVLNNVAALPQHQQQRTAYQNAVQEIKNDTTLSVKQRNRKLEQVKPNPKWLTHQSLWWCHDAATIAEAYTDVPADVAILRLANVDLTAIATLPVFKKTIADPPPGRSFCRLGFPFVQVTATYDDAAGRFVMQNFTLPPMFPNDGIHTRMMVYGDIATGRRFIETASPGLMGQSGGPLFDVDGVVWGIQSRTSFLDLGFSPEKEGSKEHQFMNVGQASHIQYALALSDQHGVQYDSIA